VLDARRSLSKTLRGGRETSPPHNRVETGSDVVKLGTKKELQETVPLNPGLAKNGPERVLSSGEGTGRQSSHAQTRKGERSRKKSSGRGEHLQGKNLEGRTVAVWGGRGKKWLKKKKRSEKMSKTEGLTWTCRRVTNRAA